MIATVLSHRCRATADWLCDNAGTVESKASMTSPVVISRTDHAILTKARNLLLGRSQLIAIPEMSPHMRLDLVRRRWLALGLYADFCGVIKCIPENRTFCNCSMTCLVVAGVLCLTVLFDFLLLEKIETEFVNNSILFSP